MPERIEAFDVSNLGSEGIVAAMTVFVHGRPLKRDYRKFRMKDLDGPDDYASMREAVGRRFRRLLEGDLKFCEVPDLLLIDGGSVHAAAARDTLRELGLELPVFGMVKDDKHRTRAWPRRTGRRSVSAAARRSSPLSAPYRRRRTASPSNTSAACAQRSCTPPWTT